MTTDVVVDTTNQNFDLTGDGVINREDIHQWLAEAAADHGWDSTYLPGDANLDRVVDLSDHNKWNANKFTASDNWEQGDFNGDGFVDVSDRNIWNAHAFQSSSAAPQPVPEPGSLTILIFLLGLFVGRLANRRYVSESSHPW